MNSTLQSFVRVSNQMHFASRKKNRMSSWWQLATRVCHRFWARLQAVLVLLVVFSQCMRLGEASNPGLHFGTLNPTGLSGKGDIVSKLPSAAVWAVQETHLTTLGIPRFKQELKWNKSDLKMVHGAPAPFKTEGLNTIGGKHTGVCFLSNFPCRAIASDWTPDELATGRVQTASSFINGHWVNMGTAYGYANSCSIEVQQETDKLLAGLTSRIVEGSTGMRIISGDWNVTRDCLPQAEYWESLGWREIQDIAQSEWGWVPQPTCKKTTIKDFMYVSPEMVPLISNVIVDWSFFPDHAVLMFETKQLGDIPKIPMWRKPLPINYEKLQDLQDLQCDHFDLEKFQHYNPDQQYSSIYHHMEESIDTVLTQKGYPKLHSVQKGRTLTKEVKLQKIQNAPIRPNRRGDIQTDVVNSSLTFTRWTRQIRRLQHFTRCVLQDTSSNHVLEHRLNLWKKIRQASGFTPDFPRWWGSRTIVNVNAPKELPIQPATPFQASAIFQEFHVEYTKFEKTLKEARHMKATSVRERDHLIIFKDLQKEYSEPVQTLVNEDFIPIVTGGDTRDGIWFRLDKEIALGDNQSFQIDGIHIDIRQLEPCVYESSTLCAFENISDRRVHVSQLIGELGQMFDAFNKEWSTKWQREHPEPEAWSTIVDFAKCSLPTIEYDFPPISLHQWKAAVKKKRSVVQLVPTGSVVLTS